LHVGAWLRLGSWRARPDGRQRQHSEKSADVPVCHLDFLPVLVTPPRVIDTASMTAVRRIWAEV
jgi:hypothetical protein